MGREVRMVPKNYEHPTYCGRPKALKEGYEEDLSRFAEHVEIKGLQDAIEYFGGAPAMDDYMLVGVPKSERTHLMMFENTSEGTPISPAFETPEELARWLADNKASAFGSMTASYEDWLRTIKRGFAPSAIVTGGNMVSGVEGV